jgi:hypothetical protein
MEADLILKGAWLQFSKKRSQFEGLESQRIVSRMDYRLHEKLKKSFRSGNKGSFSNQEPENTGLDVEIL